MNNTLYLYFYQVNLTDTVNSLKREQPVMKRDESLLV